MRFCVQLDNFSGPLDLLLYLVRKHELDALTIRVTPVIDQYLEIMQVWQQIDIDSAGDFLEIATRLMEMKSLQMLPRYEEQEEQTEDTGHDLVSRLLEYKRFKEAAARLDEQGRRWQRRYARPASATDNASVDPADQPLCEIELWDLVSALNSVLKRQKRAAPTRIRYDDTPISVYMQQIDAQLTSARRMKFTDLFEPEMHRSQLVGLFLALLELIRHGRARVEQDTLFGAIWLICPEGASLDAVALGALDGAPPDLVRPTLHNGSA